MGKLWGLLTKPIEPLDYVVFRVEFARKFWKTYRWLLRNKWAVGASLLGVMALVTIIYLPIYQTREVSEVAKRIELEDKLRSTWAQIIAGASVGGYLAYRNIRAVERNISLTEKKHLAENFSNATKMLSSSNSYERLAGINMLGQVGRSAPDYGRLVLEALAAYLRNAHPADSALLNRWDDECPEVEPEVPRAIGVVFGLTRYKYNEPKGVPYLTGERVNLAGANLRGIRAHKVTLECSLMSNADLLNVRLYNVYLDSADLRNARLAKSKLWGVSFEGAKLSNANLVGAELKEVVLTDAKLDGALLHGADLEEAEGLEQEQVNTALGDRTTKLPPGLVMPPHWLESEVYLPEEVKEFEEIEIVEIPSPSDCSSNLPIAPNITDPPLPGT